jgi:hypothetical protein
MQWMRLCDGGHESSAFPMTTSFATPSAIAIFFTEKQGALSLFLSLSASFRLTRREKEMVIALWLGPRHFSRVGKFRVQIRI